MQPFYRSTRIKDKTTEEQFPPLNVAAMYLL
jgi:hypothetical protein